VTPIAGWCAATATSIVLASVALLPVLRASAPDDSALAQLPAADTGSFPVPLPGLTSGGPANTKDPASSPTAGGSVTGGATGGATPGGAPPGGGDGTGDGGTGEGPTGGGSTSGGQGATPTRPPARTTTPPTTTEDGWTVTTGTDGVRTYVRSFRVEGGQAVIRMTSRAVVSLVTATPADGWAVQKVQDSPDNMAVYFNETGHSFIIHATWHNDRPFTQVSEIGA
jgi:hypothetical protein